MLVDGIVCELGGLLAERYANGGQSSMPHVGRTHHARLAVGGDL